MGALTFGPIAVPLREDEHGAIRVGDTRVLLDLVIGEFERGASAEEIVASFDALKLADVYAVICCFLRDPGPIQDYLGRRQSEAKALRQKIEATQPPRPDLCAMLMARAKAKENTHAPVD